MLGGLGDVHAFQIYEETRGAHLQRLDGKSGPGNYATKKMFDRDFRQYLK